MKKPSITDIETLMAVLPQTQCGHCDYPSCNAYTQAILSQQATIDRCLPGGVTTLKKLAQLTAQEAHPYVEDLSHKQLPPATAMIDEDLCIGCTKCIQACPVDAIIGSAKLMHTILSDECTGCGLCLDPCPVDCIQLLPQQQAQYTPAKARQRYEARQQRHAQQQQQAQENHQAAIHMDIESPDQAIAAKQDYIQQALARVRAKKHDSQ